MLLGTERKSTDPKVRFVPCWKIARKDASLMLKTILLHWAKKLMSQDEAAFTKAEFSFSNPEDVEAIPKFDREKVSVEVPIKGIGNLYSFSMVDGGMLFSQLSCLQCTVAAKSSFCCFYLHDLQ